MVARTLVPAILYLAWLGTSACFNPDLPDVAFRCGDEGQCPDGYECMPDGCCHKKGTEYAPADWCASQTDAQADAVTDAAMDAQPDADIDAETDAQPDAETDGALPPSLESLEPTDSTITEGEQFSFTVTLSGAAPSGGTQLTVSSDQPAVLSVPASVTVAASETQAQFQATAAGPGSATVTVTDGSVTRQAHVTVAASTATAGDLVITEFFVRVQGQDLQFVELSNLSDHTVNLAGWDITIDQAHNAIQSADMTQAPLYLEPGDYAYGVANPANPADIPADAFFVYGQAGGASSLSATGGTLALSDGTTEIDAVDFSQVSTDPDGTAATAQFPLLSGQSTQLDASCLSASGNDDASCWCAPVTSSPGQANQPCRPTVINEAFPNPSGTDDGLEFIEIQGPAGASLASWTLRWADADGTILGSQSLTGRLPNNGYFVLADDSGGSTAVPNHDATTPLGLADAGGGIQLLAPDGTEVDALGYGNLAAAQDAQDSLPLVEADLSDAAPVSEGQSLARSLDSADTGHNSADFHLDPTPTPGEPNQL